MHVKQVVEHKCTKCGDPVRIPKLLVKLGAEEERRCRRCTNALLRMFKGGEVLVQSGMFAGEEE